MVATFARLPTTPFISPLVGTLLPDKPQTPAPSSPANSPPKKGAFVNRYMPPRLPLSQRPGFALRSAQTTAVKPQSASLHKWLWPSAGAANSAISNTATVSDAAFTAGSAAVVSSGYGDLDAELPGGGWPLRQVTELLLPQSACGELRLLLPLLQRTTRAGNSVALISPADTAGVAQSAAVSPSPFSAFAALLPSLNAEGLYIDHLMIMQPAGNGGNVKNSADAAAHRAGGHAASSCDALLSALLVAAEQALHSAQFAVVVLWWPKPMKSEHTRRLHAAAAASRGAVFVCRPITAELETSPAALRLALCRTSDSRTPNAASQLSVRLIKRRGAVTTCTLRLQLAKTSEPSKLAARQVNGNASSHSRTSDQGDLGDLAVNSRRDVQALNQTPTQAQTPAKTHSQARTRRIDSSSDGRQFMSGNFDDIIAALDIASQAEMVRSEQRA